MLEFLKEIKSIDLYRHGLKVEKCLRYDSVAAEMRRFFEVSLKVIYKTVYKIYNPLQFQRDFKKESSIDFFINQNKAFRSYLSREYSLSENDLSTINTIRLAANKYLHEGDQKPSDEDVRRWFQCLYSFSCCFYNRQTGKKAPEWSDSQYDKLYADAQSPADQQNVINQLKALIAKLTASNRDISEELSAAEKENKNLRKRIEELAVKPDPDSIRTIAILKKELDDSQKRITALTARLEQVQKELLAALRQLANTPAPTSKSGGSSFAESAIEAASTFYEYLVEKEKSDIKKSGKEVCRVLRIERDKEYKDRVVYCLYLDKAPRSIDSIRIVIGEKQYEESEIKPLKSNRVKATLHVAVADKKEDPLRTASPETVCVVSDMKFLIHNVLQWYRLYGDRIQLPVTVPAAANKNIPELKKTPTIDQKEAINGVMHFPISYVWGAPGTGKTQFVLSRSILNYIKEKKRVLVTAPTNNALDQTLKGLIEVFNEAGVNFNELVFRYGIPTHEFATKYPKICEDYGLKKSIEEINDLIENAEEEQNAWKQLVDLLPKYKQYFKTETLFSELERDYPDQSKNVRSLIAEVKEQERVLSEAQGKGAETHNTLCGLQETRTKIAAKEAKLRKAVERDSIFKRIGLIDNERLIEKLSATTQNLQELDYQIEESKTVLEETANTIAGIQTTLADVRSLIKKNQEAIVARLRPWKDICSTVANADESSLETALARVDSFINTTRAFLLEKKKEFSPLEGKRPEDVQAKWEYYEGEIKRLKAKRDALLENANHNDPESCLVVAATVDKVISTFDPDTTSFSHIFLDEAGYCPLIKGVVLTAFYSPVTLLGDHMQLPPVCELDQQKLSEKKYMPVTLFAQSALYIESAFSESLDQICSDYNANRSPLFKEMKKFALIRSHRFGPELAQILDEAVYKTNFQGDPKVKTSIYFIDAPKDSDSKDRISESELLAIDRYLAYKEGSQEDIGILTPYTKLGSQVWSLKKIAAKHGFSRDDVMNVHKSQGREWNTVVLSVVDTTNMYFTDSTNKKAKSLQLINTAVSRAKKELILVCDYNFWIRQNNQLIGKLLRVAKEYPYVNN